MKKIGRQSDFKGTVPPKNYKKIASNEVWTCSWCCRENLQLCDVCKGDLGGVLWHYNPSVFNKCLQKDRSPEKFHFYIIWRTELSHFLSYKTDIGFRRSGILWSTSYREFYSIFEFWQKIHRLNFQFFRQKTFSSEKKL